MKESYRMRHHVARGRTGGDWDVSKFPWTLHPPAECNWMSGLSSVAVNGSRQLNPTDTENHEQWPNAFGLSRWELRRSGCCNTWSAQWRDTGRAGEVRSKNQGRKDLMSLVKVFKLFFLWTVGTLWRSFRTEYCNQDQIRQVRWYLHHQAGGSEFVSSKASSSYRSRWFSNG